MCVAELGDAAAAPSTGLEKTKNQKKRAREKLRKQLRTEQRQRSARTIPKEPGQVTGTGRGSTGHKAPPKGILKTTSAFP